MEKTKTLTKNKSKETVFYIRDPKTTEPILPLNYISVIPQFITEETKCKENFMTLCSTSKQTYCKVWF